MSDVKLDKPYKQRFKGVEHFLRRVAFNLGNTPSQTEVKIISCIPIDVTDLQAKIQFLERQLQETNRYHSKSSKSKRSALVTPPLGDLEPLQSGTGGGIGGTFDYRGGAFGNKNCEGIEKGGIVGAKNYVVGDKSGIVGEKVGAVGEKIDAVGDRTGSKSSEIIDKNASKNGAVGDKIKSKSSEVFDKKGAKSDSKNSALNNKTDAKDKKKGNVNDKDGAIGDKSSKSNTGGTVVNAVLFGGGSYANQSKTIGFSSDKSLRSDRSRYRPSYSGSGASRRKKSNVSFVLPAIPTSEVHPYCSSSSHENIDPEGAVKNIAEAERKLAAAEHYYNNVFKKSRRKKRVCRGKSKVKTHLVYFSQHTENNPFNTNIPLEHLVTSNNTVSVSQAYLDNVMRKQYDPKFVIQEFSDTSHFSRPVCRDNSKNFARSSLFESDVCSCCHGRFQNIDNYMPNDFDFINKITQCDANYTNKVYYDANLYDVVPVKENTNKEVNLLKRDIEIKCWPEQCRSKYRHDAKTVNYQAQSPLNQRVHLNYQKIKHMGNSEKCNVEEKRINKTSKGSPRNFYMNCEINRNDASSSANSKKSDPINTIVFKNQLIETDNLKTYLLVNNQSTQLEEIPNDNKTESTLNQIKSILQSVLAEVKTNTKVDGSIEKTTKKDAVVQKGPSQDHMEGQSTLLHSFTYNHSYNNNPYLPSCSRQLSTGQYCPLGMPYQPSLKYLQNFPVFIHPSSRRRLCACYYKNSLHKSSQYNQAAATNTDNEKAGEIQKSAGNMETEKLIKEIYKSMAASMEFPTKENSVSEYDYVKSTKNDFINESNVKDVRNAVVDKRDIEVEALISSNESSTSRLVYNAGNTLSKDTKRAIEVRCHDKPTNKINHEKLYPRFKDHSTETIIEDEEFSETASEDSKGEDVIDIKEFETSPKHKRKSLLRRMFNSVKMFKKRKVGQKIQIESEVSEASDSDGYETIYSGRTAAMQQQNLKYSHKQSPPSKRKSQNQKDAFIRSLHKNRRTSPYMEQEYRRHWNERLMFDKQERKYSSERPFCNPVKDNRPVYWNNYEARSVLVDKPSPLKYVNSNPKVGKNLKRDSIDEINEGTSKDKLKWFRKHKLVNCGKQWKKFVLEN